MELVGIIYTSEAEKVIYTLSTLPYGGWSATKEVIKMLGLDEL